MERFERLCENFYGCDLHTGRLELRIGRSCVFFFIVQNDTDTEFMKKQALQFVLLNSCNGSEFYGDHSLEWADAFCEAHDSVLKSGSANFVTVHKSLDELIDSIKRQLSERYFVPVDHFLIYDDEEIYKSVITAI